MVVDGYASYNYKVTDSNGSESTKTEDFVHCNLGWRGTDNGFYLSGVFDTNNIPKADSRSEYQYYYGHL